VERCTKYEGGIEMPRITTVQKARKEAGRCGGCGTDIKKGDPYKWLKKRYGPRKVRCGKCAFKASDHAGGRLAEVYCAMEDAEDQISGWDGEDIEELRGYLEEAATNIRDLGEQYQESADNIRQSFSESSTADECEEKAEGLTSWADEIESCDLDDYEPEGSEDQEPFDEKCPECGNAMVVQEKDDKPTNTWDCTNEECQHVYEHGDEDDDEDDSEAKQRWADEQRDRALSVVSECPL